MKTSEFQKEIIHIKLKKHKRLTPFSCNLSIQTSILFGQVSEWLGTIYDSDTKETIPFSTIEIFQDSLLIGGVLSDSFGSFKLTMDKSRTHIRVGFIGYIKSIIIEDERPALELLNGFIDRTPFLQCTETYESGLDLSQQQLDQTDLLFLDIQTPGLDGLSFLKSISNPPPVIITTAFADYAHFPSNVILGR